MRGTSATALGGLYNFYCRQCGKAMSAKSTPDICTWCGNSMVDVGFGISGDNSVNETSSYSYGGRGPTIVNKDKWIR